MNIDDITKQKILSSAKLEAVVNDFQTLKKAGKDREGKCGKCGKKLTISPSKDIFKCFSCGFSGKGAVDFLMKHEDKSYQDALKFCADKYGILITDPLPKRTNGKGKLKEKSFCARQLASSGLIEDDTIAKVYLDDEAKTLKEVQVFQTGTLDQYGNLTSGDDMIIWYYDLDGKQVMYQKHGTSKMLPFFRVRWQIPEQHKDKAGRSMKYKSPYKSGNHIYIPQKVRNMYMHKRPIKRLFLQEGEKKAEKACKHGIMSVGIAGIHNIGSNGKLPHELQLLVRHCEVEQVIFMLDSDIYDISQDIKSGDKVDNRPWSFFNAVKSFKEYFKGFHNIGIYLEIFFGHIVKNERGDKGIDDYLAGTLKGKPKELIDDIEFAINEKDGAGEHVHIYKITELTDSRILQYWNLDSAEKFARQHHSILENIPEFQIGKHRWRFRDGNFESAQPMEDNEQYWETHEKEDRSGNAYKTYNFDYENCYRFLHNRGYGRLMMASGKAVLVHNQNMIVEVVESWQVKDYLMQFTKEISHKPIINMLYKGGPQYLGPQSLSNLDFFYPTYHKNDQDTQYLFFSDNYWKVTHNEIKEEPISELQYHIWKDKINNFKATRIAQPMVQVERVRNIESSDPSQMYSYQVTFGPNAKACHFLQFLINTSDFWWKKRKAGEQISEEENNENLLHLVSKMTAFGYLVHQYFDKANAKAVIGMDGKLSEIGSSHGGSGKSLFGDAIGEVVPQVTIAAKSKRLTEDPFLLEEVNERIDNVFLDDVRANLDFEYFFPYITGKFKVNQKGIGRFTIPPDMTPKFYIATNHAINGEGSSFKRRQAFIAFSDYYNDSHSPIDDFGKRFFDDWDETEWNLFYNLVAECVQLFLRYGLIEPPMEDLEMRRLRQKMGEDFLAWAELYYSIDDQNVSDHLNHREARKEVYEDFFKDYPHQRKFITATKFKQRIKAFCKYKGFVFNPHLFDSNGIAFNVDKKGSPIIDDKSGSVEYFTVANEFFSESKFNTEPF